MGKESKKRKSNNTNPIQKLSDIVPELALFDKVPKRFAHNQFLTKAGSTARYSKEKKLSKDTKSKIKSLFSSEHLLAVTCMLDLLREIPDLSRDERNRWQNKLADFYDKVKDLLFESLDNNVSNQDKFKELVMEEMNINVRLTADAGTYLGCGTIDKKTGVVKFPKPAKTRQEIEQQEKDRQSKGDLMTLTVAVKKFDVSKTTLRRAIKDGRLKNYNTNNKSKSSLVMISESEVAKHWTRK